MKNGRFRRNVFIRKKNYHNKVYSYKDIEEYISSVVKKRGLKSKRRYYDFDKLLNELEGEVLGRGNVYPIKGSDSLRKFLRRLQKRHDLEAFDKNAR